MQPMCFPAFPNSVIARYSSAKMKDTHSPHTATIPRIHETSPMSCAAAASEPFEAPQLAHGAEQCLTVGMWLTFNDCAAPLLTENHSQPVLQQSAQLTTVHRAREAGDRLL